MRRRPLMYRVLQIATAVTFVLLTGVAALWMRSYYVRDTLHIARSGGPSHTVQSIVGNVHVLTDVGPAGTTFFGHASDRLSPNAIWNGGMSGYPPKVRSHVGIVWQHYTRTHWSFAQRPGVPAMTTSHRLIVLPYWLLTTTAAAAPVAGLWRLRRSGRPAFDGVRCAACGYDLRATPDRCPECGTPSTAGG